MLFYRQTNLSEVLSEVAALPFQTHANYRTLSIDFG